MSHLSESNIAFSKFYNRLKLIVYLPTEIMVPLLEFIINEIEQDGHIYLKFKSYLRTKINPKYAERVSYYELIIDYYKTFSHITAYVSESYHARLNRWCFNIKKSGKLNELIKKVKCHFHNNQIGVRLFKIINKMFDCFWEKLFVLFLNFSLFLFFLSVF